MTELMTFAEARLVFLQHHFKLKYVMVCMKLGPASDYPGERIFVVVDGAEANNYLAKSS